jgi:hypothetical protein
MISCHWLKNNKGQLTPDKGQLPRFRVFGVLAAARAVFLQAQPVFHVLFVFR